MRTALPTSSSIGAGFERWTSIKRGVDDESPNIPLPGDPYTEMPEGEFEENMVLAVECYAGKVGARDGVKLEDEVWVSAQGPVVLSTYPYDWRLR